MATHHTKALTIALVYELKSSYLASGYNEADYKDFLEEEDIVALEQALCSLGHKAIRIGDIRDLVSAFNTEDYKLWNLVFNIAVGMGGAAREAQVPALLEAYRIPFFGADAAASVVCQEKVKTKMILEHFGIPTAPFCVISREDISSPTSACQGTHSDIIPRCRHAEALKSYPLFAKPAAEYSSTGTQKISQASELEPTISNLRAQHPGQDILLEKFLPGREFTVGILGTGPRAMVLGMHEIRWKAQPQIDYYTYELKQSWETFNSSAEHVVPNTVTDDESQIACETALAAYRALGCRDVGRVDLRSDEAGVPHVLELNPRPGIRPGWSDLAIIASNAGLSYEQLIGGIVDSALERARV